MRHKHEHPAQVAERKEKRRERAIDNYTRKLLQRVKRQVQKAADILETGEYTMSDRFHGESLNLRVTLTLQDDINNLISDLDEELETL